MSTQKLNRKPSYKTESVILDNGITVQISRVALADLDTLLELQEQLIKAYVDVDGAIGKIIGDTVIQSTLKTICNLIPIVNPKASDPEYLEFDTLSENWEQLVILFFNGGFDINTRTLKSIEPSKISSLHFLPYAELTNKYVEEKKLQEKKES